MNPRASNPPLLSRVVGRRILLVLVHLGGAATLILPLLLGHAPKNAVGIGHTGDAPWIFALMVPLLLAIAVGELTSHRLDSKTIALLGVLCGLNAALRMPGGLAGASLVFFLPIVAGAIYGTTFGFLLGSLSFAASAVVTAGIGPWLPFQMLAAGWVGAGAGLLRPAVAHSKPIVSVIMLCVYGYIAGLLFGVVTDLWFWPYFAAGDAAIGWHAGMGAANALRAFRRFYLVTSFAWDAGRSVGNVVLIAVLGIPAMRLLQRRRDRMFLATPSA